MAINFLNNGVFAGDVTIPEYIYHTGNTSQDRFGFSGNDTFVIRTNGTDKFTADANSAILLEAGITKLQTTSGGVDITGDVNASGNIVANGGNLTINGSFPRFNMYSNDAGEDDWSIINNNGIFGIYNNTVATYALSITETVNTVVINSGNIQLNGTGRITGVDTVSANTDAANKLYVDNAISGVPQGTVTISGTPANNQLAVWTSATSIEGEAELTYDGSTFTVGGTGNTTTFLDVIGTNTAGAPATAAAIRIYGYEGRGEGIFYYDSAYSAAEWYSGIPYGGGNTYQIGYDASGNQAQYTANAVMRMDASKNTVFSGNVTIVDTKVLKLGALYLQDAGAGRLGFNRDTSNGAIHDSTYNAFQLQVNTTGAGGMLEIQEYNGAGTFVGNTYITGNGIMINDYVIHNGDESTYFGFEGNDSWRVVTNSSERISVNNSGLRIGSGARVTTTLDEDNMSSNSATALATQQSIKQYVDTAVSNAGTVTGTGVSGRVAFWNGTSSIASNSTLSWDDSNAELGIGTSSPTTSLTIARGHSNTRMNLYYPGGTNAQKAYIDMWASEPGVTYNGSGIGSNINGSPYYGRKVTEQGQTYIRFIDGQFEVYTGTNSSGTGSTAAKRFQINDSGLATFYQVPVVGTMATSDNSTRSASTAFVTTAIGNVNTGVQSVSDDGGSTINVSGSATARVVAAITGTVSSSSANLATGAQIQTAINEATTGALKFVSEWSAAGTAGGSPDLRLAATHIPGNYYIVSVAGSATPNGAGTTPNEWAVGDWCIRADLATDTWQKIDNTQVGNVTGTGSAGKVAYWNSNTNITNDGDLLFDGANLTVGGNISIADDINITNAGGVFSFAGSGYIGAADNFYVGGSSNGTDHTYIGDNGRNVTIYNGATLTISGALNLQTLSNATTDTDKFLVSDSGVVKYRTGAQVLSDIGGAPASGSGNYLPVANPTFTGTLTGPTVRITSELSVDGAMLAGNTFSDPDLVLTVLDTDTTQSIRDKIIDNATITKVSDSTAPAPGVFAVNGSNYPQGFGPYYTIDEGDTFTFEFWVKKESGAATSALLYAGCNFYNSSGTYLGNSQRYWGESALQVGSMNNWYHVSGTLGPQRGSNTGDIPTTAVSMRLLFLFNYNTNGSIVTHYCGLKVYKSGKTVTQLYRKTLGSEANTTRNRDLVVDQNGDLYGSNLTITGNLIGNTSNTTELGTYSTGAIKRIRMSQGGELHFGDTTTTAPLGITEGDWNNFGDQDRLSIYGRASIKFYAGATSAVLAATLASTGLTLNTITNASASDKFLVSDSGIIKYRTAAQVLSDIGAASSGSLGNYLPLAGGTMSGTINSTATTALQMDGAAAAQGVLMQADSSGTYPVFLRSLNPASGGETSPWLYKEESTPWGIWHNNPINSFDWTRSGNNLGIANNVGGQTNSVMIRLNSADGSGTFAGTVTAGSYFLGDDASISLATTGAGTVFLRPNGQSTSGQMKVESNGNATFAGSVFVNQSSDLTTQALQVNGFIDITDVTSTALRWYNGSTFRGGLGLDSWAHSGSDNDITMYISGDNSFHVSTNNVKRLEIDSSRANFTGDVVVNNSLSFSTNGFADFGNIGTGAMRFKPSGNTLALTLTGANATFAGTVETTKVRSDIMNNKADTANIIYRSGTDTIIGNNASALVVEDGGNVGIGTTSPDLKLDVTHATAGEYVATFQNTGANLELKLGVTSTSYLNIQGQQINNSAAFNISLQADGGSVGINTTIPTQKLHVVGNARVTGAYYDSNNSPGTANQVLVSTATGTDWVDGSGSSIIGGPYLPLAGGTLTGGLIGLYSKFTQGVYDDSSGIRVLNPGGGSRTTQASSTTGAIKITLPVSWTNTMMRMTIKVYEYTTNESFTVVCGGYNYSPSESWYNDFAYIESSAKLDRNFKVRFGHDGSKCCIYIGELTSSWTYTQVFVTDVQLGYSGLTASNWRSGWDVDFEASAFGTITQTQVDTQINNWARSGSDISYTSAGGSVLVATQAASDNSTKAASTAYVTTAVAAVPLGNYVTLATAQTISGAKTFTGITQFNEHTQHADNIQARWGAGNDLAIFHNGTNNYIASTAKDMYYTGSAVTGTSAYSQIFKQTNFNGGDEEYLRISGPTRQVLFSRDAKFIDNVKCTFGTSATNSPGDLEIYHDGTDSIIENTNGDLYIINESLDKDVIIQSDNGATGEVTDYFRADGSTGSAILYGNYGTVQLTTTSTGISTNTIDATVSAGSAGDFVVMDGTRLAARTAAQVLSDIGAMSSFNLRGDSGSTVAISQGLMVDIAGGTNISTAMVASGTTRTLTITNGITNNNQLTNGAGYTTNTGTVTSIATTSPILGGTITSTGTISLLQPASGARFRGVSVIGSDGLMEVGRYIDFHNSSTGTTDFDARLDCYSAGNLQLTGNFKSTGNVLCEGLGVGINPPREAIEVYGSSKNIAITNTAETDAGIIFRDSGGIATQAAAIKFNSGDQKLKFFVNDETAQRMVIDTSGNVGIGTSTPDYKLEVAGTMFSQGNFGNRNSAQTIGVQFEPGSTTATTMAVYSDELKIYYKGPNSTRFELEESGTARKPGGGSWSSTSDKRVKKDITNYTKGLAEILAIQPVNYKYNGKAGLPEEKQQVGVIAQDVQAAFPNAVETYKALFNEDDTEETELLAFNPSELTFTLINAIKEQQEIIEDLKTRITKLEN